MPRRASLPPMVGSQCTSTPSPQARQPPLAGFTGSGRAQLGDSPLRRTLPPGAQCRQHPANAPHVPPWIPTPVRAPQCMFAHAYERGGPSFEFRWGHHSFPCKIDLSMVFRFLPSRPPWCPFLAPLRWHHSGIASQLRPSRRGERRIREPLDRGPWTAYASGAAADRKAVRRPSRLNVR